MHDDLIDPFLNCVMIHGHPHDLEDIVSVSSWLADVADIVFAIRAGTSSQVDHV